MMSEKLSSACGLALGLAIFSLVAVGCGGSSGGSGGGQVAPATHTALVVGDASGAAYDAITSKYKIVHGSGSENPAKFDLILFDGNSTDAQQLHDNPGTSAFLYAGKMLVIVNPFLSHRDKGLKGILWVRPLGSSPAVTVFENYDSNGVPQGHTAVEFPTAVEDSGSSTPQVSTAPTRSVPLSALSAEQLSQLADQWVATFQTKYQEQQSQQAKSQAAVVSSPEQAIGGASIGQGQDVKGFDYEQPVSMVANSAINHPSVTVVPNPPYWSDTTSPPGVACANADQYSGMNNGQCAVNTGTPINYSIQGSGNVETRLYALLTNNQPQQQVIIVRQLANSSPPPNLAATQPGCFAVLWELGIYSWKCSGPEWAVDSYNLNSLLGFNVDLNSVVAWPTALNLTATELNPQASNNVTQLSTSTTQSFQVSVSATAGIDDGKFAGNLSAGFSYGWSWTQGTTVNLSDWTTQPILGQDAATGQTTATYDYFAANNSPDTKQQVVQGEESTSPGVGNSSLSFNAGMLTALQTSALETGTETVLETSGALLNDDEQLNSTFNINLGEVYNDFNQANSGTPSDGSRVLTYGAMHLFQILQPMTIDFSTPTLQPPVLATTWSMSASAPAPNSSSNPTSYSSTISLTPINSSQNQTINMSYAIIGSNGINTAPSSNLCSTNSTFTPANSVVTSIPATVTLTPQGSQFTANFAAEGQPYNVQIVSYQPQGNLQYAVCVTVPAG